MRSPYGLGLPENCLTCEMRNEHTFCGLSASALQRFETIKHPTVYPPGAVLFVEGQAPRGIFVICSGRAKLSFSRTNGKTLIPKIAEAGEVLGISSSINGKPYQFTAETLEACQISFVKCGDFVQFVQEYSDVCFRVAKQLSKEYHEACRGFVRTDCPIR